MLYVVGDATKNSTAVTRLSGTDRKELVPATDALNALAGALDEGHSDHLLDCADDRPARDTRELEAEAVAFVVDVRGLRVSLVYPLAPRARIYGNSSPAWTGPPWV